MRIALISDIHGNMDALEVVLADIDRRIDTNKGDQIWCLGDIIGYGPDSVLCVDTVAKRCKWALMGNHDYGVLYEPTNFNAVAEAAAYWTRSEFEAEAKRDRSLAAYHHYELASASVQIAIVLASAEVITGVAALVWISLGLGLLGAAFCAIGTFWPMAVHLF